MENNSLYKIIIIFGLIISSNSTSLGQIDQVEYSIDLENVNYWGETLTTLDSFSIAPNLEITAFGWKNLRIETFDNRSSGATMWNRARDLSLGFTSSNPWLEDVTWASPFIQGGFGNFGPSTIEYDLSDNGYKTNSNGQLDLIAASSYNDSTGLPAGTLISGSLYIIVAPVPAPGALLLPLFWLIGFKSRRNNF